MEAALSGSGTKVTGTSSAARSMGGLETWLSTNQTHLSSDGTTPGSGTTVTDGISNLAALTQTPFEDIIRQIWVSGGDPKRALVGPLSKIVISGFSGIATLQKNVGAGQGTIVA